MDMDNLRFGVQRASMKANPLLNKSEIGTTKRSLPMDVSATMHGMKSAPNEGAAASMGEWGDQKPSVKDLKQPIGRVRTPQNKEVVTMVHGRKSVKGDGVSASIQSWDQGKEQGKKAIDGNKATLYKAEVGRARPPQKSGVERKIHGAPSLPNDGGTAAVLTEWQAQEGSVKTYDANNHLIVKTELGKARRPMHSATGKKTHGVKSKSPSIEGGVRGAMTQPIANASTSAPANHLMEKSILGRAKKPISDGCEDMTHGHKTGVRIGGVGAQEALSNWNPATPENARSKKITPPGNNQETYGKRSGVSAGVKDLMDNKYQKEWAKAQIQRDAARIKATKK